ncbi:MAG: hypothetical protein ACLGIN_12330 [Candidatus Sericytochromatia bacterium]
MQMRDTTLDANSRAEMQNYYLYHAESPDARWAISVEQVVEGRFNVAVAYREPAWDVYGTIRYWVYDDRSLAEARYLELQRLFGDLDEAITMKALERNLPPVEAHWHHEE